MTFFLKRLRDLSVWSVFGDKIDTSPCWHIGREHCSATWIVEILNRKKRSFAFVILGISQKFPCFLSLPLVRLKCLPLTWPSYNSLACHVRVKLTLTAYEWVNAYFWRRGGLLLRLSSSDPLTGEWPDDGVRVSAWTFSLFFILSFFSDTLSPPPSLPLPSLTYRLLPLPLLPAVPLTYHLASFLPTSLAYRSGFFLLYLGHFVVSLSFFFFAP